MQVFGRYLLWLFFFLNQLVNVNWGKVLNLCSQAILIFVAASERNFPIKSGLANMCKYFLRASHREAGPLTGRPGLSHGGRASYRASQNPFGLGMLFPRSSAFWHPVGSCKFCEIKKVCLYAIFLPLKPVLTNDFFLQKDFVFLFKKKYQSAVFFCWAWIKDKKMEFS